MARAHSRVPFRVLLNKSVTSEVDVRRHARSVEDHKLENRCSPTERARCGHEHEHERHRSDERTK
jgi:hypothetical protein